MRLLNVNTLLLEEYFDRNVPPYAILSHRWRDDEVSFQDIQGPPPTHKAGYEKIRQTCLRASEDGFTHAWVDTCCIDKSSSAELSESINAMFRWYAKATVCYAYLDDVGNLSGDEEGQVSALAGSEWFERGWTLQELLAPTNLVFYSSNWSVLGNRDLFLDTIQERTGIDRLFLTFLDRKEGHHIHEASIAERMSWASNRQTTRSEDVAYCMLGILGVSMPLLYGEGEAAFIRLQEELIKHSDDQTLLAWNVSLPEENEKQSPEEEAEASIEHSYEGVLAKSPAAFAGCGNLIPRQGNYKANPFSVTNKGLTIEAPLCTTEPYGLYLLLLCGPSDDPTAMKALPLWHIQGNQYARGIGQPAKIAYNEWKNWPARTVHLLVRPVSPALDRGSEKGGIWIREIPDGFQFDEAFPPGRWSLRHRLLGSSVSRGLLNAVAPAPSFTLQPSDDQHNLPSVQITLEAILLPRTVTRAFSMSPYRASYAKMTSKTSKNHASSAESSMGVSQRVRGPNYIYLPDGSLLYASMSLQNVLHNDFLIIDIKITRRLMEKTWILFWHSCADCFAMRLSFPTDLSAIKSWLSTIELVFGLSTVAVLLWWITMLVIQWFFSRNGYVASIFHWRDKRSLKARSIAIDAFWMVYSVLSRSSRYNNGFGVFFVTFSRFMFHIMQITISRTLKILPLVTWAAVTLIEDRYQWSKPVCFMLWAASYIYFLQWMVNRLHALPPNRQPRDQNNQKLTEDSCFMLAFCVCIQLVLIAIFFMNFQEPKNL